MTQNLHDGKQTDVINMDFSKALGEVIHNLLIHKLKYNNIRGKINNWIESFLLDRTRTQTVIIEGKKSSYLFKYRFWSAPWITPGSTSVSLLYQLYV